MEESVEQTEMFERLNSLSRRVDELEKEVWKLKKAVFSTVQSPDTVQGQQYSAGRTPENKKNKNMEQTVGKFLMGILASVLILFSLILFGGLIYRAIPDAVKVGIMFTVSAVIAGVGIMACCNRFSGKREIKDVRIHMQCGTDYFFHAGISPVDRTGNCFVCPLQEKVL